MPIIEIIKEDPRISKLQFLAKALKNGDDRFHVTTLKVESDGSAVALDGARLHWVADIELEKGYYKMVRCTKTKISIDRIADLDDANLPGYPQYSDLLLLPDVEPLDLMMTTVDNGNSKAYTAIVRAMVGRVTINFNFVNDLCATWDGIASVYIPPPTLNNRTGDDETNGAVIFTMPEYQAIIMPMNL